MKRKERKSGNFFRQQIFAHSELRGKKKKDNSHLLKNKVLMRILLVVLLLPASVLNSNAQFQWGVKLGGNFSTLSEIGDICNNEGLKAGFNAGIISRYQLSDWMALKSGIDYKSVGKKCDIEGEDAHLKYDLDYLSIPLKAEFSASEKAGFKNGQRLFFATGPYCGYLVNSSQTIPKQTSDVSEFDDFDWGWAFELGIELPALKDNSFQVSLNYDMGLFKVMRDNDMRNKSLSLNIGFLF